MTQQSEGPASYVILCNVIVSGYVTFLPNQEILRKYIIFSLSTKSSRGSDEMVSRAGFGSQAVVWRPWSKAIVEPKPAKQKIDFWGGTTHTRSTPSRFPDKRPNRSHLHRAPKTRMAKGSASPKSIPGNKEAKHELKVTHNNETLPFCSEPTFLGGMLDRLVTYRQHLESLRKKLTSCVELLRRLAGSGWGVGATNVANRHLSLDPFYSGVLHSCLVPQCSHTLHWPCHQRRLANCHWMHSSCWQSFNSCWHPTCWDSSQRSHTVSRMCCRWLHRPWTTEASTSERW